MMNFKSALMVAAIAGATILGGQSAAQAASPSLQPLASLTKQAVSENSSVQKVHYRSSRKWRVRCARRHGWHNARYRRCLRRHTVHAHPRRYCRSWRARCANRWGWNTPRFRGCLRNHGCY